MVTRHEIPNDLKECSTTQHGQASLTWHSWRVGAAWGARSRGLGPDQSTPQPLNLLFFKSRSNKAHMQRKIMCIRMQIYTPLSTQTLSKKLIEPFLKICACTRCSRRIRLSTPWSKVDWPSCRQQEYMTYPLGVTAGGRLRGPMTSS